MLLSGCSRKQRSISSILLLQVMAEELPGVLILDIGGTHGVLEDLAALLKKHFHLITMKEFLGNKEEMSKKIQSIFVFECRPTIDRELLESLPNLKVIGNSGVGVDHLDLKMISSFGVKVTNTPHAVADPTADIGMALMLASARRLVEGNVFSFLGPSYFFGILTFDVIEMIFLNQYLGCFYREKFSEALTFGGIYFYVSLLFRATVTRVRLLSKLCT